jgi:MFS family permease
MSEFEQEFIEPLEVAAAENRPYTAPDGKSHQRALILMLFTIFLDVLGIGILAPVIPYLLQPYNKSALIVGTLMMSFSVAQFLASPVLGALSDRYGRRPILLISIFGSSLAYFAFGFAASLWVFFAARIVDGLTGGNISTAQAYITDITPPQDRSKTFGLIGAIFGAGFIIGPALGGVLSYISLQAPAFVAGGMSLLACIFGFFMVPETLNPANRSKKLRTHEMFNPIGQLWRYVRTPEIMMIFIARFILMFAMTTMRSNFLVYARDRLNFGPHQVGYYYAFLGFLIVMVQGGVVRRIAPKWGDRLMTLVGFISLIIGFTGMGLAPNAVGVGFCMLFIGCGHGLSFPTLTAMASKAVNDSEQGGVLGAQQSVNSLAMIIAPFVAGLAFDHIGMGAPYLIAAVMLLVAVYISWNWRVQKVESRG